MNDVEAVFNLVYRDADGVKRTIASCRARGAVGNPSGAERAAIPPGFKPPPFPCHAAEEAPPEPGIHEQVQHCDRVRHAVLTDIHSSTNEK